MTRSEDHSNELLALEERLYEVVAHEIKVGEIREGLWLKAFAESSGDKSLAEATYVKFRVAQLLREAIEAGENENRPSQEEIQRALKKAEEFRKIIKPEKW